MTLDRRISALEGVFHPVDHGLMSDDDRRWFLGLCDASCATVVCRFAGFLAQRRYHHEAGARGAHADDWKATTTEDERRSCVQAELDRLRVAFELQDGDDALTGWVETADREGWPPLTGLTFSMWRSGFDDLLHRSRQSIDAARAADIPAAAQWRREHPTWRPGMTGEEATAFELELSREAEWFGQDERAPAGR